MKMIQRGKNDKYPEIIDTWRFYEKVPSWLSDQAQVKFIDGEGNITLDYINLSTGGREILKSGRQGVLVRLDNINSFVCHSPGLPLFSLRPKQIELLYIAIDEVK